MLKEDQAACLLHRCEELVGDKLTNIRTTLKDPERRASAVWELLCMDAFSAVAPVCHEPDRKSRPDLVLFFSREADVWFEVAFVYPRFHRSERLKKRLEKSITEKCKYHGVPRHKISTHYFSGVQQSWAKTVHLPEEHEVKGVMNSQVVSSFFDEITSRPCRVVETLLSPYSVVLRYNPNAFGPYVSSSGVVEDAPTCVSEHALHRVLEKKRKQHDPPGPYVVCVGSDQNRTFDGQSNRFGASVEDVLEDVFRKSRSISAVIVVSIEELVSGIVPAARRSNCFVYENPNARFPLSKVHIGKFNALDFNRWRYFFPIQSWEKGCIETFRRSGGDMSVERSRKTIEIAIPEDTLMRCLAGTHSVRDDYGELAAYVENGWVVTDCRFQEPALEEGRSGRVVLTLEPAHESVYFGNER